MSGEKRTLQEWMNSARATHQPECRHTQARMQLHCPLCVWHHELMIAETRVLSRGELMEELARHLSTSHLDSISRE